mgnify:CR=1 FL=1
MKKLHVTWEQYHRLIEQLASQVYASGWDFQAIVCLARGGMRVGDVLSRIFDKPLGVLFTSSYREDSGTKQSRLQIAEHMSSAMPLPGSRWLLVDDLVDSGATLVELRRSGVEVAGLTHAAGLSSTGSATLDAYLDQWRHWQQGTS